LDCFIHTDVQPGGGREIGNSIALRKVANLFLGNLRWKIALAADEEDGNLRSKLLCILEMVVEVVEGSVVVQVETEKVSVGA
jgi:hypothetical protein